MRAGPESPWQRNCYPSDGGNSMSHVPKLRDQGVIRAADRQGAGRSRRCGRKNRRAEPETRGTRLIGRAPVLLARLDQKANFASRARQTS